VAFLRKHPLHTLRFADQELVILTTPDGANRVYETRGSSFRRQRADGTLEDAEGGVWRVTGAALVREGGHEQRARRPAHRAFWFGWHAQFPDTVLVR